MVIEEKDNTQQANAAAQSAPPPPSSIDNIMSGISNTGSVRMNNHRKKLRQRFDIIKKLGQGTYGKVQLGINKETSQEVAIKTIKKCKIETEADLVRIRREVQIMSSVQHPNIIHIYEVFENREKMVLVMEFAAGGELYDYLSERKVLTEEEARRIFRQIATAVYYCHKHKICHRDLKLENILLDENGNAKIADFGLSNVFDEKRLLATFCGSPLYASPEIVKGTPYQGPEVDCWSLGVLLYTLVYGAMPFDGSNFKRLVKQISSADYYEPKKPSNASPLIKDMLTVCPKRRATIEQICNHWWVNEGYQECCLDVAEELANQTPVRLDVLLSLAPPAVTTDQLVVQNEVDNKPNVTRSMSVGSILDIGDIANTEAEKRIIEMVSAGGEAALAPSPTRTITPSPSAALQVKRKPETTISTDSMTGARKREKPTEYTKNAQSKLSITEVMDVDRNESADKDETEKSISELSSATLPDVIASKPQDNEVNKRSASHKTKAQSDTIIEEMPSNALQKAITDEPKATKSVGKTKSADLSETTKRTEEDESNTAEVKPTTERRRSRILEVAEKFEASNTTGAADKAKKFSLPSTSKKEVERRASLPQAAPVKASVEKAKPEVLPTDDRAIVPKSEIKDGTQSTSSSGRDIDLTKCDSKTSTFSLEEARRSMENSIALLNKAKMESNNELDQLCAKTENVAVSSELDDHERQKKLKNAREIIGNAIPRLGGMGVRKPPVPFGANGRSISGSVVSPSAASPPISRPLGSAILPEQSPVKDDQANKVSTAEVTLKSATLPRRKLDSPRVLSKPEEQQPAQARDQQYQSPFNSVYTSRATSLEPQNKSKEHYIPIHRPGYVASTTSSSHRIPLSRQSTNESDTSDTQTTSTATLATQLQTSGSSQPIKKSPREFIIPIAVEGGGFITPRAGSLEPSNSNDSTGTGTAFNRLASRQRKISSIFNDSEDESSNSPFYRMQRHTSVGRDSDTETDPTSRFTYRLRSTRPSKKNQAADGNDSVSSGEEDDDDGFEILTAENLFSTLLQRVRALTNRLNIKDDSNSEFPSARFMNNLRQTHSPFWHHDPFNSRLNSSGAWRHSMTRDLGTDIDSAFSSRTGATLPKDDKSKCNTDYLKSNTTQPNDSRTTINIDQLKNNAKQSNDDKLDLGDLDLTQLRLTRKDLETLSSITPNLPKHYQEQLLAQLPPNQARKLSRTLSMQGTATAPRIYKRSLSSGRDTYADQMASAANASSKIATFYEDDPRANGLSLLSFDRNSVLRRSVSRTRDNSTQRRSTSALRTEMPTRLSYTGDLRTDSQIYTANKQNDTLAGRYRLHEYTSALPPTTTRTDFYSKLPMPSGYSPSKSPSNENLEPGSRLRLSQRSANPRFSRSELFGSSTNLTAADESGTIHRARQERERETQNVLREIRERSRDRAKVETAPDISNNADDKEHRRKSSIPNIRITVDKQNGRIYHARNKSAEHIFDGEEPKNDKIKKEHGQRTRTNTTIGINGESSRESAASFTESVLTELLERSQEKTKTLKSHSKVDDDGTKSKSKSKECKKVKTKQKSVDAVEKQPNGHVEVPNKEDSPEDVQSITLPLPKASRIARRQSYPTKDENDKAKPIEKTSRAEPATSDSKAENEPVQKYANSKLVPPKELSARKTKATTENGTVVTTRNVITAAVEKFIEKSAERLSPAKSISATKSKTDVKETSPTKTKKKIKVIKKVTKSDQSSSTELNARKSAGTSSESSPVKETKSPEKKTKSGFLYSIGQKFEKMRESSKNKEKEKKTSKTVEVSNASNGVGEKARNDSPEVIAKEPELIQTFIIPRRSSHKQDGSVVQQPAEEITIRKIEIPQSNNANTTAEQRMSRIDAVIRNLRERSVPHTVRAENRESQLSTESGLLKRAVSVEDMANGEENFNKGNVNKVLGLFRRIEREQMAQKLAHGTVSNGNCEVKERPKSGGFVGKLKKAKPYYTGAKSDTIISLTDQIDRQYLIEKADQTISNTKIPLLRSTAQGKHYKSSNEFPEDAKANCSVIVDRSREEKNMQKSMQSNDAKTNMTSDWIQKQHNSPSTSDMANNTLSEKERIRNNRKGLVLDLNNEQYNEQFKRIANSDNSNEKPYTYSGNGNYYSMPSTNCNGSNDTNHNHKNNNFGYHFYDHSDRNVDTMTPSCTSYSSDNRSTRDDCESTSAFLTPSEEPELCFDNWSACSGSTEEQAVSLHPKHTKFAAPRNPVQPSEQNFNPVPDPAPSTPSDSESVIDRIKRRSYYCRFNEKKPKRTSTIVGTAAQREYYREMANKSKSRNEASNGLTVDDDSCYSHGDSKSPTPINVRDTPSRATTPFSIGDETDKYKGMNTLYLNHYHNRSQTPSQSRKSPFEANDQNRVKSSDYLNLRSTMTSPTSLTPSSHRHFTSASPSTVDYHTNGNHRSFPIRNSAYDGISAASSIYGTYNPKRRLSTSYLASSISAANSSNGFNSTDHPMSNSCFATIGRHKPKSYDSRSVSLLDTNAYSPTSLLTAKRLNSTNSADHQYSHYRPLHEYNSFNSRSSLRSPTIPHSSTSNS